MTKVIDIKVGEATLTKTPQEQKAEYLVLLENYKEQNPVKYAAKEKRGEFAKRLAELDAMIPSEAPKKETSKKVAVKNK